MTVSDGDASDTMTVTITVTGANDAPAVVTEIAETSVDEDDISFSLDVSTSFADADTGDVLTYSATGLPTSGNLVISSAGVISGTPLNADVGIYTVVVTATDDSSTTAPSTVTDTFTLTVVNTNDLTTGTVTITVTHMMMRF